MARTDNDDLITDADKAAGKYAAILIENGKYSDNARLMHNDVSRILGCHGFYVENEFRTNRLGEPGRIDIVATRAGGRVAIEIDCRRPRTKSIRKLRVFDGYRLVVLRGVEIGFDIDGIDQTVAARVVA